MPASPTSASPESATTGVTRLRLPWCGEQKCCVVSAQCLANESHSGPLDQRATGGSRQTRTAGDLTITNKCSHYVLTIENLLEAPQMNGRDGNDSHHPPCRPGCLLCFRRAAARPFVARQAHSRRWCGCACRFLRSQGLRGARWHARTAGARTLSATHLCQRPFPPLPTARRCRDQGGQRFHAPRRAHFHRRGLCRRRGLHPSLRSACLPRKWRSPTG
jgi:hypothetical protein